MGKFLIKSKCQNSPNQKTASVKKVKWEKTPLLKSDLRSDLTFFHLSTPFLFVNSDFSRGVFSRTAAH